MFRRVGIRFAATLIGIAVGLALSDLLLDGFTASTTALIEATIVFWIVNMVVNFLALKVLVRNPSVAIAGMLALASTIVSLFIVNLICVGGLDPRSGLPWGDTDHLGDDDTRRSAGWTADP